MTRKVNETWYDGYKEGLKKGEEFATTRLAELEKEREEWNHERIGFELKIARLETTILKYQLQQPNPFEMVAFARSSHNLDESKIWFSKYSQKWHKWANPNWVEITENEAIELFKAQFKSTNNANTGGN